MHVSGGYYRHIAMHRIIGRASGFINADGTPYRTVKCGCNHGPECYIGPVSAHRVSNNDLANWLVRGVVLNADAPLEAAARQC